MLWLESGFDEFASVVGCGSAEVPAARLDIAVLT
jgi:hypothetical protein